MRMSKIYVKLFIIFLKRTNKEREREREREREKEREQIDTHQTDATCTYIYSQPVEYINFNN